MKIDNFFFYKGKRREKNAVQNKLATINVEMEIGFY